MNFIWKIENFSSIKDKAFLSPSFNFDSKLWEVHIHWGKISADNDKISLTIQSVNIYTTDNDFLPSCSVGILDIEGSPLVWHEGKIKWIKESTYRYRLSYHCTLVKNHDIIGSRKSVFLPNNVLTIQCCLWRDREELALSTIRLAHSSNFEVFKKSFISTINEIQSLREHPIEQYLQIPITSESCIIKPVWNINFQLMLNIKSTFCKFFMLCKICLVESSGKKIQYETRKHYFSANGEVWSMETGIFTSLLSLHPTRFSHLKIICTIANKEDLLKDNNIKEMKMSPGSQNSTISKDLQHMYAQEFLSDFKLKVGEREFPVHKAVLGARSSVFRAMFTSGMIESERACTDIKDIDADTLRRLLDFIYTDKVEEDMDCDSACCLYVAADKYDVESLKRSCSAVLASQLCVENVIDVLILADKHSDDDALHDDLKLAAQEFISRNAKEIVGQEKWNDFAEENGKLANQTWQMLYMKKMNG